MKHLPCSINAIFTCTFEGNAPAGFVSVEEVKKALMSYGTEKLTLEQATELTAQLESDARGLINYEEYVNVSRLLLSFSYS